MKSLHVIFWILLLSNHPPSIASNNPKHEPAKINISMLGIQIDGNSDHWILLEGYLRLHQGSVIGPCHFRKVVMDQEPRYAVSLCSGKDEVRVKVGEFLKASNTSNREPRKNFNCFEHYFKRTYYDALKRVQ